MIHIKAILAYIVLIGVAVLYTLFLEGAGGSYLIIALAAAAVISVAVCLYTKRMLTASIEISADVLNRGESVTVSLVLNKAGVLPSSFIDAELYSSYHFSADSEQRIRTSVFGSGKAYFSASYKAAFFGKGRVGISSVTVTDYLGLVSFRVDLPKTSETVKVYPDIPEVDRREGLARSLTDAAAFDESEETTQSLYAINGTPGYEHRKYEPGDSLKLINWKISAKRGELYVRRLEGASGAEQTFVLDKACSPNKEPLEARAEEQLAVEGMLALMMQFAKTELPAKLAVRFGGGWEIIPSLTPNDVSDIRYRLTEYEFADEGGGRVPQSLEGHAVIFTARFDGAVSAAVAGRDDRAAATPVCAARGENIWLITRDEEDIRFEK
ncbi:MAG: DUF58 domain-containing protein [Ruminiclostridium sp.]|nr:DUF58 domain-containing protein [Ruminiclostridium sp.]